MRRNVLIIMVIALAGAALGQWTGATPKGDFSELQIGGTTVITSGRVLQNATANASVITAGTLSTDRYSAAADLAAELTPSVDQTVKWSGTAWVATGFPSAGNYGNTITVAKSGGDYDTIQAAVDAATLGTTIVVYPGTYTEQITLNKQISLVGVDKFTCRIEYNATGDYSNAVVNVTADGCAVKSVSIENSYNSGTAGATALTVRKQNFRITDCNIESGGRDTIWIVGNDAVDGELIINNCFIRGDYDVISATRSILIKNSEIVMNSTSDNGYIWADASATWGHNVVITVLSCFGRGGGSGAKRLLASSSGGYTVTLNASNYYCESGGGEVGGTCTIGDYNYAGTLNVHDNIIVDGNIDCTNLNGNVIGGTVSAIGSGGTPSILAQSVSGGDYAYMRFIQPGFQFSDDGANWIVNLYKPESEEVLKTDDAFDAASLKIGGTEVINSSGNSVLNATPASAGVSGDVVTLTAGENLVFGDVCYAKSDGKYWKAKGDAAGTMPAVAMAAGTISASATGSFLLRGYARNDSWSALTIGGQVWVSAATGGVFTQTQPSGSGNLVQNIGYATAAKVIYFDPERTVITLP